MRAMVFERPGRPLQLIDAPTPKPGPGELLLKVLACGLCRTDLHIVDGDLPNPQLPLIPGHQIIGSIVEIGSEVSTFSVGQRVGVPWLGNCCETCSYCKRGAENLCDKIQFTGYHLNGGFAEYCTARADFSYAIPSGYPDLQAAPLLCAGLIGFRSLNMAGPGKKLGFYGFGAAAHILIQIARHKGQEVYVFTRPGDQEAIAFAKSCGAVWAGGSDEKSPVLLNSAIIFAPQGHLVPTALEQVVKGGTVVCAGIHMSNIPSFPYRLLWGERTLKSVANLTREDGVNFLQLAPQIPIKTTTVAYPLERANEALEDLRHGRFTGAAVIVPQYIPEF